MMPFLKILKGELDKLLHSNQEMAKKKLKRM